MLKTKTDPKYVAPTVLALGKLKWDALGEREMDAKLNHANSAIDACQGARLDIKLKIADKQRDILKAWPTAKLQDMHYLENDLLALRKEDARYERLLRKAEAARQYVIRRMDERRVVA